MSEEMNEVEVKIYTVGDLVKGVVTKVEEKQVMSLNYNHGSNT